MTSIEFNAFDSFFNSVSSGNKGNYERSEHYQTYGTVEQTYTEYFDQIGKIASDLFINELFRLKGVYSWYLENKTAPKGWEVNLLPVSNMCLFPTNVYNKNRISIDDPDSKNYLYVIIKEKIEFHFDENFILKLMIVRETNSFTMYYRDILEIYLNAGCVYFRYENNEFVSRSGIKLSSEMTLKYLTQKLIQIQKTINSL